MKSKKFELYSEENLDVLNVFIVSAIKDNLIWIMKTIYLRTIGCLIFSILTIIIHAEYFPSYAKEQSQDFFSIEASRFYQWGRDDIKSSQYGRALENLHEAFNQFKALNNIKWQILTLNQLGIAYFGEGNFLASKQNFETALHLLKFLSPDQQHEINQVSIYFNLGEIYRYFEQHLQALEAYQSALFHISSTQLSINQIQTAKIYLRLALIYDFLDQPRLAQEALNNAVQISYQSSILNVSRSSLEVNVYTIQEERIYLVVQLNNKQVSLYEGEKLLRRYPLGIGRLGWETPQGKFKIENMVYKPTWENPLTGEVFAPGDPLNALGNYWLGFFMMGEWWYGFHQTNEIDTVGQASSHGCLRMYEADIAEMFLWVKKGTSVVITE